MRTLTLFFAWLMAGPLLFAADAPSTDTRPEVRIGVSTALTGEMAHFGQSATAWGNYALAQLQKNGTQLRYRVFYEDDQMQAKQAILAAKRLVELNKVNVLLSYSSPTGSVIAPYAHQKHIPHFAVAYNPAAASGDYSVVMMSSVDQYVEPFLKLLEKKNYKRLAVFYVRNATWQPVYDTLKKEASLNKFSIVYEQIYTPGERDFRLGVQQIPVDQVDAILLLSWAPEVNILAQRLAEQKVSKPLVGMGGAYLMGGGASEFFEGALDIYAGDLTQTDRLNRQLTGHPIYSPAGSLVYDQILLTADIYERAWAKNKKLISPEDFVAEVKKLKDFPTILGPATCLPSNFFSFQPHYYRIQNGTFKVLELNDL